MTQDALFDIPKELHAAQKIYRKDRNAQRETARILILVKAQPQPSASYGDTVCVAGIRVDTPEYKWVRLYPIPFRSLDHYQQFKKYSFINVPITPAQKDFRAESYNPERDKLCIEDSPVLKKPHDRMEYIEPLISDLTMCQILSIARRTDKDKLYPSLAAIKPSKIIDLQIKPFEGWSDKQRNAIINSATQGDLLGLLNNEPAKKMLEEPRFETHLRYHCGDERCRSHFQLFLDWELESFTRRHRDDSDEEAIKKIQKRWATVLAPEKEPVLFVGNQQKAPLSYSVLGVQRTR